MALTYGFYNSVNHDRLYDAIQISSMFDGIIRDGVFATVGEAFVVKATEQENTVIVSSGRAWFNHTWTLNDADLPRTGEDPEIALDRIDALVIDVNANENYRENDIIWVKGLPSENPERPELIHTLDHNQYPICYVLRKERQPIIHQEDITSVIGTDECPFVTGPLQVVSIEKLLLQWQDEWDRFVKRYELDAVEWTKEQEDAFETFRVGFQKQLEDLQDAYSKNWDDWFAGIHSILDGDVAGHLQSEIETIIETEFNRYYGLMSSNTTINDATEVITTVSDDATITTEFETTKEGDVIKTTIVPVDGLFQYVRTTTITETEEGSSIKSKYSKLSK